MTFSCSLRLIAAAQLELSAPVSGHLDSAAAASTEPIAESF